jgi:hypothetical protein
MAVRTAGIVGYTVAVEPEWLEIVNGDLRIYRLPSSMECVLRL